MYKLLIFDVDGTLVDTDPVLLATYKELYRLFRTDLSSISEEKIKGFSGPPLRETLTTEFPQFEYDFIYREYKNRSLPYYYKYLKTFPNTKEVLKKLKEIGFVMAIATSKNDEGIKTTFEITGIGEYFDLVVTTDSVVKKKPHPECVNKILNTLNFKKEETLYIGDSRYDSECARRAGVDCAIMTMMKRRIPKIEKIKYYFDSFNDLFDEVSKLYG